MNKTLLSIALISILGFTVNANANTALVGLADAPYPGSDHDFQDLTFSISGATLSVSRPPIADSFDTETGQSIPTGIQGTVDGTVTEVSSGSFSATTATLTYEYGPAGLVGGTGHGDSTSWNAMWVQDSTYTSEAAAVTAGHYFANFTGTVGGISFVQSTVGNIFNDASLNFHFAYELQPGGGGHTDLINGMTQPTSIPYPNNGAYLAAVPEPMTLIMLGLGLLGFGYSRRHVLSDFKGLSA